MLGKKCNLLKAIFRSFPVQHKKCIRYSKLLIFLVRFFCVLYFSKNLSGSKGGIHNVWESLKINIKRSKNKHSYVWPKKIVIFKNCNNVNHAKIDMFDLKTLNLKNYICKICQNKPFYVGHKNNHQIKTNRKKLTNVYTISFAKRHRYIQFGD